MILCVLRPGLLQPALDRTCGRPGADQGHGRNALHHMVSTGGEITVLDRLMGMGVDVDAQDVRGRR